MRIFLLGFMGSGKSSLGKEIAHKLGYKFLDLDKMIEVKAGLKVSEIFKVSGEEKFREIEHECLKDSILYDNNVISTGGGTPCFFDNMEIINNNGVSVYIKLNVGILTSRLFKDKGERPLLKQTYNKVDFQKHIKELLTIREEYYLQSKIILEGENLKAITIIEVLKDFNFS
jgi:shikimate kinase